MSRTSLDAISSGERDYLKHHLITAGQLIHLVSRLTHDKTDYKEQCSCDKQREQESWCVDVYCYDILIFFLSLIPSLSLSHSLSLSLSLHMSYVVSAAAIHRRRHC